MKFLICIIVIIDCTIILANDCLHRDYGHGSKVCVCNNQHCDIIPKIQKTNSTSYLIITSNKEGQRFNISTGVFKKMRTERRIIKNMYRENRKEYLNEQVYAEQKIEDYETCKKKFRRSLKEPWNNINNSEESNRECKKLYINQQITFQSILGWGGAFTDSTGLNIKSLNEDLQNKLMMSYFGDDGLEYNVARVPIGGTDFSIRGYTYLDTDEDEDFCEDPLLTKFKLAKEDHLYKIPLIKEALKLRKELLLLGSAWTAPKWMKENRKYRGTMAYLHKNMYKPWANYFIKFLDAYRDHNITFWGVTTGNEVFYAMALAEIPAVLWIPEEQRDWIRFHFGPAIRNSSHSDIKILANDDNRPILLHSLNTIFSEKETENFIDGTAVHWYYDTDHNAYMLDEIHQKYPNKFLLYTEACNGLSKPPVLLGSWERGESYANNIIQDLNHWVVGWMDWNMALNEQGGPTYLNNFVDSSIIVNASAQEFYKQPMYYAIGHFSKFIPRDSIRIYSSQCDSDVKIVAFKKPDGGITIVILNKTAKIQRKTLFDDMKGYIQLELSPHSITTILYW